MSNVTLSRNKIEAVIFDLDGVVTKTADVHARAWKRMFDDFLEDYSKEKEIPFVPFDEGSDYLQFVDGKPRYDGIQSFLESRGVELPWGDPADPPSKATVCGMATKKNQMFLAELKEHGIGVYDSTIDLIKQLRKSGLKTAIISSSKNCKPILETLGLLHLFDVKVDGVDAEERKIKGKPAPDVFLTAAKDLHTDPEHSVVVEDAISGVQAGHSGGFSLVIGVDRTGQAEDLRKNGADVVVKDLSEVQLQVNDQKNAIEAFDEIQSLAKGMKVVIFFDYDGTLTPIVSHPELAVLADDMKETLETLTKYYTVAVISGRDRPDVENHVGVEGLFFAGSHGFDIAGPNDYHFENDEAAPYLEILGKAESELNAKLEWIEGAWVERKKYSVAAHYRQTPEESIPEVEQAIDDVQSQYPELRKAMGKKIFELQPNIDWHKGKALHWLLKLFKLDREDVLPIYLGDDVTDEDAFKALKEHGLGIAIQDHPTPTAAKYLLRDPEEVKKFMELLIQDKA